MNEIAGILCPSVVCCRTGLAFTWQDDTGRWHSADELPPAIVAALPPSEADRCERHRFRRMADRRVA